MKKDRKSIGKKRKSVVTHSKKIVAHTTNTQQISMPKFKKKCSHSIFSAVQSINWLCDFDKRPSLKPEILRQISIGKPESEQVQTVVNCRFQ